MHVCDNGVGIAPEDTDRIFQPFTRCNPSFPGTGVGLAMVRRIVERHGGRIWATGEPELATAILIFPVAALGYAPPRWSPFDTGLTARRLGPLDRLKF